MCFWGFLLSVFSPLILESNSWKQQEQMEFHVVTLMEII